MSPLRYRNPILPGFHPDPSICRHGTDYYLVTSSFAYSPGIPIFHSRNLIDWSQLGHVLNRESQLPLNGATHDFGFLSHCRNSLGIWAPTIRYNAGTFYVVSTNMSHGGHFVVEAKDPAGPWSEPRWIDAPGIDPSLYFEGDRAYFLSNEWPHGRHGLVMAELDLASGRLTEPTRVIWRGSGAKSPEGPHLYRRGGFYYLLAAEGGTEAGHLISIARSRDLYGPYEGCPHNPILSHRSLDHPIQNTGHGDLVEAPDGTWWLVFLGVRPIGYPPCHVLGRETFLAPVRWENDWPIVDQPVPLSVGDLAVEPRSDTFRDDFAGTALGPRWNFLRNLPRDAWCLAAPTHALALRCRAPTLDEALVSPSFIGIRQTSVDSRVTVSVDISDLRDGDEAGLVAYMSETTYCALGVQRTVDGARLRLGRKTLGFERIDFFPAPAATRLELCLSSNTKTYEFSCAGKVVGDFPARLLSTEVAGGFTGVFFGLYATGCGTDRGTSARFREFCCDSKIS